MEILISISLAVLVFLCSPRFEYLTAHSEQSSTLWPWNQIELSLMQTHLRKELQRHHRHLQDVRSRCFVDMTEIIADMNKVCNFYWRISSPRKLLLYYHSDYLHSTSQPASRSTNRRPVILQDMLACSRMRSCTFLFKLRFSIWSLPTQNKCMAYILMMRIGETAAY